MDDLIIVGAGVAGMTASLYASRYKIKHLIFDEKPGGQGTLAGVVENYPGFISVQGPALMEKFVQQVEHYGIKIKREKVKGLAKTKKGFLVKTDKGEYPTRSLILAMGAAYRHLNIPGEEKFLGRGVSYCTNCDSPLFREKTVAIVGGGDSAVTGAIHAAAFAQKVFIIHRRDKYRAEPTWVKRMRKNPKIIEVLDNEAVKILGNQTVKEVVLKKPYQGKKSLPVEGVFIEIGQVPSSALAKELGVELDKQGYVKVNSALQTNIKGVFAVGDLAAIEGGILFRQFVTSAADGARAAAGVYQYLHRQAPAPSWGKDA